MKITKLNHSCLLVELLAPVNRTALFDPGEFSAGLVDVNSLDYLDDIVVTHEHFDHFSAELTKKLVQKFPDVRITAPPSVVEKLQQLGISASAEAPEGMRLFHAPHDPVEPLFPTPEEIGVHYLEALSHPGDSLHFDETKAILALPVDGPWGATVDAINLAVRLRPQYVLPIHDAMWTEDWRKLMYDGMEQIFAQQDITFFKLANGQPVTVDVTSLAEVG
jgi:L-ascorbate metabolism protein UlaG (beta-lactamase superfamily)